VKKASKTILFQYTCRYFVGEKPCRYKRTCPGCPHFSPFTRRILIIKLGALGDVLRTTPLLRRLKEDFPQSQITWLTDAAAVSLLRDNRHIDRLFHCSFEHETILRAERFDLLINLDKAPFAAALASLLYAKKKLGFGMHPAGAICPLNKEAQYAFRLGVDDELKFRKNRKTYQEIVFEACGFRYAGEAYELPCADLTDDELSRRGIPELKRPVIGLNTGAGSLFAGKGWTREGWKSLIDIVVRDLRGTCLLLGGERERELNAWLMRKCAHPSLFDTGWDNPLPVFVSLVGLCDLVVCGDTLGMHIAIGLRKKVVALFGSTCPQEIDLYGRGVIVQADDIPCAPCYRRTCDKGEICLSGISVETVAGAVKRLLK